MPQKIAAAHHRSVPSASSNAGGRYDTVDALRGAAMIWMTVFHFCFDLSHFGVWAQDFRGDPFWTSQRTMIVALFLFTAGLGQAIAWQQQTTWRRFFRRWVQIAACAALVTLGSALMFPRSFIFFGVLHGMAVMLLAARLSSAAGTWLWPMGLVALCMPSVAQWALSGPWQDAAQLLNSRAFSWLGFVSRKPFTEDYVPVLPWLGVMWWGMATGQWLLRNRATWLACRLPHSAQPLALLGRFSLSYYMLHQPVMIGAIMAFGYLTGGLH